AIGVRGAAAGGCRNRAGVLHAARSRRALGGVRAIRVCLATTRDREREALVRRGVTRIERAGVLVVAGPVCRTASRAPGVTAGLGRRVALFRRTGVAVVAVGVRLATIRRLGDGASTGLGVASPGDASVGPFAIGIVYAARDGLRRRRAPVSHGVARV